MSWIAKTASTLKRLFHWVFTFMVSPKSVLEKEFGPIDEDERFRNIPKKEANTDL